MMELNNEFVRIVFPIMNRPSATSESIVEQMMSQMDYLVEIGALKGKVEDLIQDYDIDTSNGYINVTIPKDSMIWADKLETVGAGMAPVFKVTEEWIPKENIRVTEEGVAIFSASTINERLRLAKKDPRVRFRYLTMDYKRYWNSNKNKILNDEELLKGLRNMFLSDVMNLFTEVIPYIEEGRQLSTLIGTNQVTPALNKISRELSLAYKKALKAEGNTGMINKTLYQGLKSKYTEFMVALMDAVLPGINESSDSDPELGAEKLTAQVEESRKYSRTADGRIKFLDNLKSKQYSTTKDGRIKLF